ncbi:hypothetical protein C8F04DRAFT_1233232 [Mycena alexandri]|uniref:Uncharacterized protein n=1 Tax=Mycena alexandri TaxID=1745969 RepID=A0AAD6X628_9AGAR|nr:hypothetical protein C8F04DRAFT_1233232 [Mycena alexandri]
MMFPHMPGVSRTILQIRVKWTIHSGENDLSPESVFLPIRTKTSEKVLNDQEAILVSCVPGVVQLLRPLRKTSQTPKHKICERKEIQNDSLRLDAQCNWVMKHEFVSLGLSGISGMFTKAGFWGRFYWLQIPTEFVSLGLSGISGMFTKAGFWGRFYWLQIPTEFVSLGLSGISGMFTKAGFWDSIFKHIDEVIECLDTSSESHRCLLEDFAPRQLPDIYRHKNCWYASILIQPLSAAAGSELCDVDPVHVNLPAPFRPFFGTLGPRQYGFMLLDRLLPVGLTSRGAICFTDVKGTSFSQPFTATFTAL